MAHVEGLEQVATVKATLAIIAIPFGVLEPHLKTWEARRKDDARSFTLNLRDLPISNQAQPTLANLFNGRQWDSCISQSQQTCCHGQLRADVPGKNRLRINSKLFGEVKGALEASQLWDVAKHLGLVHVHRTITAFDEADDVFVEKPLLVFVGNLTDAGFTSDEFLKRIFGKHPVHARQPQRNTGDDIRVHVATRSGLERSDCLNGDGLER